TAIEGQVGVVALAIQVLSCQDFAARLCIGQVPACRLGGFPCFALHRNSSGRLRDAIEITACGRHQPSAIRHTLKALRWFSEEGRGVALMRAPKKSAIFPNLHFRHGRTDEDRGQVAEWSNVPDSKSGVRASVPWVRIPPCPPLLSFDQRLPSVRQLIRPLVVCLIVELRKRQ